MRRAEDTSEEESPGGDSFLDIVANIVGILVLLVVVVGVRAGRQVFFAEAAPAADVESLDTLRDRLKQATFEARSAAEDAHGLRDKLHAAAAETSRRDQDRQEATLYVTKLRAELDEAERSLAEGDRRSLEAHNAISQAQLTLDRLSREEISLASAAAETEVETISVSPAPIVDGKADVVIGFRLKGDRLCYLPIDELQAQLQSRIKPPAITDPTKAIRTECSVGPIEGFVANATIRWGVQVHGARIGLAMSPERIVVREATTVRGETVDAAFAPGGYLASRLELLDPKTYVVQLFTYPDSFERLPEVEAKLREQGFRVAVSPKSQNGPLVFAPHGRKAVTQ